MLKKTLAALAAAALMGVSFAAQATDLVIFHTWSAPPEIAALNVLKSALAEKGAIEKARRNLARLEGLCGSNCEATRELSAAIAKGPAPRMVSAEAVKPQPVVSEN